MALACATSPAGIPLASVSNGVAEDERHSTGGALAEREIDQEVDLAEESIGEIRADYLPGDDLLQAVERGEITHEEADEILQAAARRHAAEHGPDLDTDEEGRITTGGFGAGQGMARHSAGGRKARDQTSKS